MDKRTPRQSFVEQHQSLGVDGTACVVAAASSQQCTVLLTVTVIFLKSNQHMKTGTVHAILASLSFR